MKQNKTTSEYGSSSNDIAGYTGLFGSGRMDDYGLKLLGTGTVVATAAAYWMIRKPPLFNPAFDFSTQTVDALVS